MKRTLKHFPLVSLIVPTKNVEKVLEKCLLSLKKQIYPNIEIIVVDNFSTDKTISIAKHFTNKIFLQGPERSAQRNFGIKKSRGMYVCWIDSDNILKPNIIQAAVAKVRENPHLKALIIPETSFGVGFWSKCKSLEKKCYLGDDNIEAIRFIKKGVFEEVGEMSENLISGEDWDMTIRVRQKGYEIGRIKNTLYHNEGRLTLLGDIQKKFYYATKSIPYVERHIKNPKDVLLFVFRPAFFRNWELLLKNPTLTCGIIFMKMCEFTVGFIGFLLAKFYYNKQK